MLKNFTVTIFRTVSLLFLCIILFLCVIGLFSQGVKLGFAAFLIILLSAALLLLIAKKLTLKKVLGFGLGLLH